MIPGVVLDRQGRSNASTVSAEILEAAAFSASTTSSTLTTDSRSASYPLRWSSLLPPNSTLLILRRTYDISQRGRSFNTGALPVPRVRYLSTIHIPHGSPLNPCPFPSRIPDHIRLSAVSADVDAMVPRIPTSSNSPQPPTTKFPSLSANAMPFFSSKYQGVTEAPPLRGLGEGSTPPSQH